MLNLAARLSVLVTPRLHLDSETKIVHSFFRVGENSNNSQKYMLEAKNRAYPHRRGLRSLKNFDYVLKYKSEFDHSGNYSWKQNHDFNLTWFHDDLYIFVSGRPLFTYSKIVI